MIWTHYVEILDARDDNGWEYFTIRIIDGKGQGDVLKVGHCTEIDAIMHSEMMIGQETLIRLSPNKKLIEKIHPGRMWVDKVSLSMMKMLGEPFESLRKERKLANRYRLAGSTAPDANRPGFGTIIWKYGRYHWKGINRRISFDENKVSFESETPFSIIESSNLKPLREVVDHPGIPSEAIITGGWSAKGITTFTYDVEDIDLESLFGPLRDNLNTE